MIDDIIVRMKRDREINFRRYRNSGIEHYLHFCCGLDHAIRLLEQEKSNEIKNDLPIFQIDKPLCKNFDT